MTSFNLCFTELWFMLLLFYVLLFVGAIWYVSPGRFKPSDEETKQVHSES